MEQERAARAEQARPGGGATGETVEIVETVREGSKGVVRGSMAHKAVARHCLLHLLHRVSGWFLTFRLWVLWYSRSCVREPDVGDPHWVLELETPERITLRNMRQA